MDLSAILLILIVIIVLGFLAALVTLHLKVRGKRPPDYYAIFVQGIIWLAFGSVLMAYRNYGFTGLFVLGLVFAIIGIANRDKWKKNRRTLKDLSKEEKQFRVTVLMILWALAIIGLFIFIMSVMF